MSIIERYIYTATKRLPDKIKKDVEEELRSNIYDMLPENYSETDIRNVLYELGNPVELGNRYRENSQHLIGPAFYGQYLFVLRIVLIIVLCAAPVGAFATVLLDESVNGPLAVIGNILLQTLVFLLEGGVQAFAWVTIIFAFMDKAKGTYLKWPFTGKEWSLEDLEEPRTPQNGAIPTSDPVFSIVMTLVLLIVACFFPEYVAAFEWNNGEFVSTTLFDLEVLKGYIPYILAFALYETVFSVLKLVYQRWTKRLAMLNVISHACGILLTGAFLLNERVINESFKTVFAQAANADIDMFSNLWQRGVWALILLILVMGIWNAVMVFKKVK
ncbi:MAG: hypothetical protein K0R57_2235 [Paenibacillaceae bacterium]|jgi:hypothetical protein|nr:hypothetical protein [Paenibacillaceae bacterium]